MGGVRLRLDKGPDVCRSLSVSLSFSFFFLAAKE